MPHEKNPTPSGTGSTVGCGTLPNGRGWGQDATLRPGWDRIKSSALNAVSSPHVWAPVGMALLLQIDHADERLSDWAVENTPLFGSNERADDASDLLLEASTVLFVTTALATPSGTRSNGWGLSKAKGAGIQTSAVLLTGGTTALLKTATDRTRPNGLGDDSFPSGHASIAGVGSMLAYRNTDHLQIPTWSKTTLKTGCIILPYATGWARVEAAQHYPSDVLFGTALGNFFGMFINDAFLGIDSADDLRVVFDYLPGDTITVGLNLRF